MIFFPDHSAFLILYLLLEVSILIYRTEVFSLIFSLFEGNDAMKKHRN